MRRDGRGADFGVDALRAFCFWIAARMVNRPGLYSLHRPPGRRGSRRRFPILRAALPARRSGARQGEGGVRERPSRRQAHRRQSDRCADRISRPARRSMRRRRSTLIAQGSQPSSSASPASAMSGRSRRCAAGSAEKAGNSDVATLKKYVDLLPEHLTRRFIDAEAGRGRRFGRGCRTSTPARSCRSSNSIDRCAAGSARRISRLHALGDRPLGDRRAQQRQHDRQADARASPSSSSSSPPSSGSPSARSSWRSSASCRVFSRSCLGRPARRDRTGAAIRQRRRAHRLVRPRTQRDDPFPQPSAHRSTIRARTSRSRCSGRRCSSGRR